MSGTAAVSAAAIPPLLLIGCGKMGSALFAGWVREGLAPSVMVDPAAGPAASPHRCVGRLDEVPDWFRPETVVLAVKPQMSGAVLPGLGARYPDALFVSIMAGRTVASLSGQSGARAWVRAMPNLPASVGCGVTGAFASDAVAPAQRGLAGRLLAAVGQLAWLGDEGLLDVVTAVSGSGPAYVFLLVEALEAAGARAGLPADVARLLARGTVTGSGALLAADAADARAMREAVTSKAGTTERALAVLTREGGLSDLVAEAVAAAADRSRALAS